MSAHGKRVLLHPLIERVWHWLNALCFTVLILTGIGVHWPGLSEPIGGLDLMVDVHNFFAWVLIGSFALWLVFNVISGRISHYIPMSKDYWPGTFIAGRFYALGVFMGEPHPYHPHPDNKFNPLQKISYLFVMAVLTPLLIVTGLLYLYPVFFEGVIASLGGLQVIAILHFVLGGVGTAFMIVHVYLCTMGNTVAEDFKHMISGYGTLHDEHH